MIAASWMAIMNTFSFSPVKPSSCPARIRCPVLETGGAQPFRQRHRFLPPGFGQKHDELLAAPAGKHIALPDRAAGTRRGLQHLVAVGMAMASLICLKRSMSSSMTEVS
jgi:hypothetical protein